MLAGPYAAPGQRGAASRPVPEPVTGSGQSLQGNKRQPGRKAGAKTPQHAQDSGHWCPPPSTHLPMSPAPTIHAPTPLPLHPRTLHPAPTPPTPAPTHPPPCTHSPDAMMLEWTSVTLWPAVRVRLCAAPSPHIPTTQRPLWSCPDHTSPPHSVHCTAWPRPGPSARWATSKCALGLRVPRGAEHGQWLRAPGRLGHVSSRHQRRP